MKHIISMLIENESGALSRVSGLFSARGYNIHALTVAPTNDETLSRLTLVTSGTNQQVEQIVKHLNRLIDVVKVVDITEGEHIERELMLVKLKATGVMREEIKRLADIFRGTIVDVTSTIYTVQLVGEIQKLDAFIDAIDDALIVEIVRSGAVGLMRGEKSLHL
ncbi:acetolactate synthase small subunit [Hydrogenovibrio sp. SC-1]|uniref:acetolactate synthase small subunit n=1 Tax=Hydrogenovibrio sp. SC-1 TaxID=2065820 RepID=UPI000C7A4A67|nr:acetolactate synthase small subunit [Hydrogenovibrio sp. SC-1]PLA75581.1 acetolactate synthase small subunit [Hydrogenovibrio sp. SC-1]